MTRKNERTSARVARIAGKILGRIDEHTISVYVWANRRSTKHVERFPRPLCTVAELKALAASALTQAPNRKAKK